MTNGLYPFSGAGSALQDRFSTGGSSLQNRLSSFVGNPTTPSNLFNGGIGGGNLLENQRQGLNNPILNPATNLTANLPSSLQQRLGKFSSIADQQAPRVPLKRKVRIQMRLDVINLTN